MTGSKTKMYSQSHAPTYAGVGPRLLSERNFLLILVALVWAAIIGGFGPEIAHHLITHAAPYPLVLHFHGVAFFGWLALLTAQVLLIRAHRRDLHIKLGVAGAMLAGTMVVLGPVTALVMDRIHLGTPASDPSFLSTQLLDIVEFTALVLAALLLNTAPSAHKRLMLLATFALTTAGFGRIMGVTFESRFGHSTWPYFGDTYLGGDLLVVAIAIYDLLTRRRLYPTYVAGCLWIGAAQAAAIWLYFSPSWKLLALRMIGH